MNIAPCSLEENNLSACSTEKSDLLVCELGKKLKLGERVILKGAIIGFGYIAEQGHLNGYRLRQIEGDEHQVKIVAICDHSPKRLEIAKSLLGPSVKYYTSYSELILLEKQNLDFVDITLPPSLHYEVALLALQSKLHVLCEKPITCQTKEVIHLIQVARENRRVLFPVHNYKHAPVVKAISEIIKSGQIGEVTALYLQTFRNTHALGVKEWNPNWRRDPKYSGGGIAMDHGSHSFYLTFDWLNDYPHSITAKMHTLKPLHADDLSEDHFTSTLTFPKGVASLTLSWSAGVRKVLYSIQGTKGSILVEDDNLQISLMRAGGKEDSDFNASSSGYGGIKWETKSYEISSKWMDSGHSSWFNSLFTQFINAISRDEFITLELIESAICIDTITSAYLSSSQKSEEVNLNLSLLTMAREMRLSAFNDHRTNMMQ